MWDQAFCQRIAPTEEAFPSGRNYAYWFRDHLRHSYVPVYRLSDANALRKQLGQLCSQQWALDLLEGEVLRAFTAAGDNSLGFGHADLPSEGVDFNYGVNGASSHPGEMQAETPADNVGANTALQQKFPPNRESQVLVPALMVGYAIAYIEPREALSARDLLFNADHNVVDILLTALAEVHIRMRQSPRLP